ncbi:kinase A anchor protein [Desarmillaria tabescens]|uniref:Kinase A anchor protein n=1 Tax=Armillaria tabescens TaxID=1929756 RepID=A0AA39K0A2_ARMTA|nr:kinase A anchor protein [Desarmillaria tabescens]KAK0452003.1 kinase A anchor protein [Desarmillaria tabescens]
MARPTHFLSIPLGQTHPTLRARVADLHAALNLPAQDSTLLAGPQRVHLTLGVMNLTPETLPTALDLLHRLPTLLPLTDMAPTVTLDTLDVLRRESRRRAHVLWVGPSQPIPLFSRINEIFREEGFITDMRPLKLHMTLMNSTYRRPRTKRPQPFEYDGILRQAGVLECFGVQESEYAELPMAVTMGSYDAPRVHLCEMGSWDTDGAYVSCGSAPLSANPMSMP